MGFQFINTQFFARSRKIPPRRDAETYDSTSHKEPRSLTQRLRKRAIYGWKLAVPCFPLLAQEFHFLFNAKRLGGEAAVLDHLDFAKPCQDFVYHIVKHHT